MHDFMHNLSFMHKNSVGTYFPVVILTGLKNNINT